MNLRLWNQKIETDNNTGWAVQQVILLDLACVLYRESLIVHFQKMAEAQAVDESQLVVGVALTGSRKSKYILRWALENFLPEGNVSFKLLHVYPKINVVPSGPTPSE